jgi:hypothetical protein
MRLPCILKIIKIGRTYGPRALIAKTFNQFIKLTPGA